MRYWKSNLQRPIRFAGAAVKTLEDAAGLLSRWLRKGDSNSLAVPAMSLLIQAAETGTPADIQTATAHLEQLLGEHWNLSLARPVTLAAGGNVRTINEAIELLFAAFGDTDNREINDVIDALIYAGSTGKHRDVAEAAFRFEEALRRRDLLWSP